ncbi:MAG TPA: SDR family oxidoreductase [Thermoanaerobaculia bacterium]|jgi:NAD(P)-dependent dehydrogenase (short-subunit alcohol dehydrogenase family)
MFSNEMMKGQVALITGIGHPFADAVALRFASLGARLIAVNDPRDAEAAARFEAPEGTLRYTVDGTDAAAVKAMVRTAVAAAGRVDTLICAAYYSLQESLTTIDLQKWRDVLDAQLSATLHFNREVIRPMMRNKAGRIVNVMYGVSGPASGVAARGVSSLSKTLASELATHGIYVNSLAVGQLEETTVMMPDVQRSMSVLSRQASPLGRMGRADEAAQAAVFLASDFGKLTSGHTLSAAGGVYP